MSPESTTERYIVFLRGINVGGHKKVPMAELKKMLAGMGYENVVTLLNSGNVIFDTDPDTEQNLERRISDQLEQTFGFPVPVLIRTAEAIQQLFDTDPFKDIELHKDIRLYVSFLKEDKRLGLDFPWSSDDGSFRILSDDNRSIISVLDLSISGTPQAMEFLEKQYGKDITTRNWKTINRIVAKL
ncbi:MAG: DUF1697 domain-containing protein [Roseivirga sp.]|nr:DUF1697 domain-containing protein [Roseivirga sp.]